MNKRNLRVGSKVIFNGNYYKIVNVESDCYVLEPYGSTVITNSFSVPKDAVQLPLSEGIIDSNNSSLNG